MQEAMLVLLGAVVGAIAGMAGTVIQTVVSNRGETKRQLLELAYRSGVNEFETQLKHSKPGSNVYPQAIFIQQHAELLKLIREGKLTPEKYKEAQMRTKELMQSVRDTQSEIG